MHHEDIKAAVRKRGYTLSKLATKVGTNSKDMPSKSAVSRVLRGEFKSARIAMCISNVIGIPVAALWPGMYPEIEAAQRSHTRTRKAA